MALGDEVFAPLNEIQWQPVIQLHCSLHAFVPRKQESHPHRSMTVSFAFNVPFRVHESESEAISFFFPCPMPSLNFDELMVIDLSLCYSSESYNPKSRNDKVIVVGNKNSQRGFF